MHRHIKNIKLLYIANFLTGLTFWYPIEKLFMQSIGISPFGIGINAAVFLVITVVFDVPSGVLADKWHRKYTLMLALVCLAICSAILGASSTITPYLIGTAFFGGYVVLTSGTFQAIMYDTLAEAKINKMYDRFQGRAYALFLAGVGIGSLGGGYLADWFGYRSAFFLSLIPTGIGILVLSQLTEPRIIKKTHDTKFFAHIKSSAHDLSTHKVLLHLGLFIIIGGLLRSTQNEFSGLYYIALGFGAIGSGYINAFKWFSGTLGQYLAEKTGRKILHYVPVMFISFFLFTLIDQAWGLIFFYLAVLCHAMMQNQAEAEIQDNTPSETRATTLSLLGFVSNIILIPVGLLFGWLAEEYDIYVAFQMIALIGFGYLITWLLIGRQAIRPALLARARFKTATEDPVTEIL